MIAMDPLDVSGNAPFVREAHAVLAQCDSSLVERLTHLRRTIHQEPELGFEEVRNCVNIGAFPTEDRHPTRARRDVVRTRRRLRHTLHHLVCCAVIQLPTTFALNRWYNWPPVGCLFVSRIFLI